MRILIIQDHLRIGGTERQSLFLARIFKEKGHQSVILTFRPGGHLHEKENLEGLHIETLQGFDSLISLWAPGLMQSIRKINPDVILCMGRTSNCYAGFIQRSFRNIPVVGTLRTGKWIFPLHSWSLQRVRAILVNSNWWKQRLLEKNIPGERVHVVHNSLLLDRPDEARQNARISKRSEFMVDEDTCVFLNVSTFRPGKRHIDLLRAFARLKSIHPDLKWRLWLVGDGKEYHNCKSWAAENGLGTRVRFFHYQKDPFPFYAASDLAVSVSREDSLPNFLIEAQATGLPVIAYDCRGVKETCVPNETGIIIEPGNEDLLISTLAEFASNPNKRHAFARTAPVFARSRFSRLSQAEQTLEFLQKITNPVLRASPRLS